MRRPTIRPNVYQKLKEDSNQKCSIPGCSRKINLHIHHIFDWSDIKSHDYRNLIVLCQPHHAKAGIGEITKAQLLYLKRKQSTTNNEESEVSIDNTDLFQYINSNTDIPHEITNNNLYNQQDIISGRIQFWGKVDIPIDSGHKIAKVSFDSFDEYNLKKLFQTSISNSLSIFIKDDYVHDNDKIKALLLLGKPTFLICPGTVSLIDNDIFSYGTGERYKAADFSVTINFLRIVYKLRYLKNVIVLPSRMIYKLNSNHEHKDYQYPQNQHKSIETILENDHRQQSIMTTILERAVLEVANKIDLPILQNISLEKLGQISEDIEDGLINVRRAIYDAYVIITENENLALGSDAAQTIIDDIIIPEIDRLKTMEEKLVSFHSSLRRDGVNVRDFRIVIEDIDKENKFNEYILGNIVEDKEFKDKLKQAYNSQLKQSSYYSLWRLL